MHRVPMSVLAVLILVLAAATAAYAPYHTSPSTAPPASASGAYQAQAKTAAAHASFAADGSSASYIKEHLGHTLACIEGAKGKNVNAAWENPCQGQGNGVLADLKASKDGAAWVLVAEAADNLAVAAMKSSSLPQMKTSARGASELMKLIAEGK